MTENLTQFGDQMGYIVACATEEIEVNIASVGGWITVPPTLSDNASYQYNTEINRGQIKFKVKGIWKVDISCTVNGATNDNMEFSIYNPATGNSELPSLKWNQRGGNNWAINYSIIARWKDIGIPIVLRVRNMDDTANVTFKKIIICATKLY